MNSKTTGRLRGEDLQDAMAFHLEENVWGPQEAREAENRMWQRLDEQERKEGEEIDRLKQTYVPQFIERAKFADRKAAMVSFFDGNVIATRTPPKKGEVVLGEEPWRVEIKAPIKEKFYSATTVVFPTRGHSVINMGSSKSVKEYDRKVLPSLAVEVGVHCISRLKTEENVKALISGSNDFEGSSSREEQTRKKARKVSWDNAAFM